MVGWGLGKRERGGGRVDVLKWLSETTPKTKSLFLQSGDRTHVHSPVLHYVMTSTTYTLVCVCTIATLVVIFLALLYLYFTRQVAMSPIAVSCRSCDSG